MYRGPSPQKYIDSDLLPFVILPIRFDSLFWSHRVGVPPFFLLSSEEEGVSGVLFTAARLQIEFRDTFAESNKLYFCPCICNHSNHFVFLGQNMTKPSPLVAQGSPGMSQTSLLL